MKASGRDVTVKISVLTSSNKTVLVTKRDTFKPGKLCKILCMCFCGTMNPCLVIMSMDKQTSKLPLILHLRVCLCAEIKRYKRIETITHLLCVCVCVGGGGGGGVAIMFCVCSRHRLKSSLTRSETLHIIVCLIDGGWHRISQMQYMFLIFCPVWLTVTWFDLQISKLIPFSMFKIYTFHPLYFISQ